MIIYNGTEVIFKKFPNNEVYFDTHELNHNSNENFVELKYKNDSDLIQLMILKKHLDGMNKKVSLIMRYFPYSRMDREEISGGKPFTLKYIAEFINALKFLRVSIVEPHSTVTPALLNNCHQAELIAYRLDKVKKDIAFDDEKDFIYFPDVTAYKRYNSLLKSENYLIGLKERNFDTGKLTNLKIMGKMEKERKVLMLDDLCSAGGTFLWGAEKLKEMGANDMYLFVAHCEETILNGNIFKTDLIKKVFTTNSIIDKKHETERLIFV